MWESFFGFKKTPFSDSPDSKQVFASEAWQQVRARLELLTRHPGACLLTGEVGAGKSTAARVFTAALNTSLYKILYVHFSSGSALDLLRQVPVIPLASPASSWFHNGKTLEIGYPVKAYMGTFTLAKASSKR